MELKLFVCPISVPVILAKQTDSFANEINLLLPFFFNMDLVETSQI